MEWWSPGTEALGRRLAASFGAAAWPDLPPGFTVVGKARPMRIVARGEDGVVVKWARPVRLEDRLSHRLRGGKGVREGRALRRCAERDVPAPTVLGYSDEGVDLLVVEALDDLEPLAAWTDLTRGDVEAVGSLLGRAWSAGLRQRDLTRANLGVVHGEPCLVDLGSTRLAQDGGMVRELARARASVFGDASASQRLRALRAWLDAAGAPSARDARRDLVPEVEQEARRIERRYRRGRDRRATRDGRHFVTFPPVEGGRGIRRRETPCGWEEAAAGWLRNGIDGAESLKEGGRVVKARAEGRDGWVVVKHYEGVAPGRLPRPLRAFRLSAALENRHVGVPTALLAAARGDGSGVLVSAYIEAQDLHRFTAGGRAGRWAALSPARRRALATTLGRTLRRMHDAEVSHRDLKAPNLLVREDGAGFEILVGDLDGARIRTAPLSWRRRARDLARLDASLDISATDRRRVLEAYLAGWPRPPVDRRTFTAWIARAVRAKRGPSGRPR